MRVAGAAHLPIGGEVALGKGDGLHQLTLPHQLNVRLYQGRWW